VFGKFYCEGQFMTNGTSILSSVLLVSSLCLPSVVYAGEPAKAKSTIQALMRSKLDSTHGLLEGVVHEDFEQVAKYASTLLDIGRATTWYQKDSPDFLHYAKSFENSSAFLLEQARAKNLEGVAMGYIRVTLDCMQCHRVVRAGRAK
jgi:hypothetical protein